MGVISCCSEQSSRNPTTPDLGVDHQTGDNCQLLGCQARCRPSNQGGTIADASMEGDVPDNDVVARFCDPCSQVSSVGEERRQVGGQVTRVAVELVSQPH